MTSQFSQTGLSYGYLLEIQQDENMEKEIPTLEELEERLECLLDDGTRVKQIFAPIVQFNV